MSIQNVLTRTGARHDQNLALAADLIRFKPDNACKLMELMQLGIRSPLAMIATATAQQIEDLMCMAVIGITEASIRMANELAVSES